MAWPSVLALMQRLPSTMLWSSFALVWKSKNHHRTSRLEMTWTSWWQMITCGGRLETRSTWSAYLCQRMVFPCWLYHRLVNAPAREARETADKLRHRTDRNIKLTLFSLQKFIRVCSYTVTTFQLVFDAYAGRAICKWISQPWWTEGACRRDKQLNRKHSRSKHDLRWL